MDDSSEGTGRKVDHRWVVNKEQEGTAGVDNTSASLTMMERRKLGLSY